MTGQKKIIRKKTFFLPLTIVIFAVLIINIGCSKPATPEEKIAAAKRIVEENMIQIKERMQLLKEIGSEAEKQPLITTKILELGNRPKMSKYFFMDPLEKRSRSVVNLPLYRLIEKPGENKISLSLGSWFTIIDRYVRDNYNMEWLTKPTELTLKKVESRIKDEVEEFLLPRYFMIVRTYGLLTPELIKMVESGMETKDAFGRKIAGQFRKGSVKGDVLIYDLSDRSFLGGLPFYEESSSLISAKKIKTDPKAFITDLVRAVQYKVWEQLKPYMNN